MHESIIQIARVRERLKQLNQGKKLRAGVWWYSHPVTYVYLTGLDRKSNVYESERLLDLLGRLTSYEFQNFSYRDLLRSIDITEIAVSLKSNH